MRSSEYLAAQQEEGKRRGKRALRYHACAVEGEVFLHPGTGVAAAAPEFVVYMQLVQTAVRPYMRGEATPVASTGTTWLLVESALRLPHPACRVPTGM